MTITDLTNTTWYVPSGWIATAGYGQYSVNGIDNLNDGHEIIGIWIGSNKGGGASANRVTLVDPLYDDMGSSVNYNYDNTKEISVTITGGIDTTNPSLISWLTTYGTQLKVTDLTGTTWNIKAGWECEAGYGIFAIDAIEGSQGNITSLYIGYDVNPEWGYGNTESVANSIFVVYSGSGFYVIKNTHSFTICIKGGADATNPKLIAWLTEYGELQTPSKSITFDLSTLNLSAGTHSITARSIASGYNKSPESNAVSYEVGVDLISFIINASTSGDEYNYQCYAPRGMTWTEYVASPYNTLELVITPYGYVSFQGGLAIWRDSSANIPLSPSDTIEENAIYYGRVA
jgi:hypothetical protein